MKEKIDKFDYIIKKRLHEKTTGKYRMKKGLVAVQVVVPLFLIYSNGVLYDIAIHFMARAA